VGEGICRLLEFVDCESWRRAGGDWGKGIWRFHINHDILVPAAVKMIKKGAFFWCHQLTTVFFARGWRRLEWRHFGDADS
jgi:hypothetical protein